MEDHKEKYENLLHDIDIAIAGQKEGETKIVLQNLKERNTESEDERIKKCIGMCLTDLSEQRFEDFNTTLKDCLAWLEKQDEHANFRNKIQIGDKVTRNEDGVLINFSQFKRTIKQGKHKSIDKVEQEEDAELTDFESALFSAFSDAWQEYLSGKEVNVAKWAREHSTELLEVAREQKPAWNEEDELKWNTLIHVITNQKGSAIFEGLLQEELINWLKSIKERIEGE